MTDDEQAPEERAAIAAAVQRVRDLMAQSQSWMVEIGEAMLAEDWLRGYDASIEGIAALEDVLRAQLDATQLGATAEDVGMTQAEVASSLVDQQRTYRQIFAANLDTYLALAFVDDDDPTWQALRERARALLLRRELVTEAELESFPQASVSAIVWDRFRALDEETPTP